MGREPTVASGQEADPFSVLCGIVLACGDAHRRI